jgi:putative lipoic acid-binding regulatory protein
MDETKIVFPCEYPVKVVARVAEGLRPRIDAVFVSLFGAFGDDRVVVRPSAQARFVAYTYHMVVQDEAQLGQLHEALKAQPEVVMVL